MTQTITYTASLTRTAAQTFTITITRTAAPTPTITPVIAAPAEFDITDTYIFPDPVSGAGDFTLRLSCTRRPVSIRMKIYSASFRLVRDLSWAQAGITGSYDAQSPAGCLDGFANGAYYYEISGTGDDGREAKSRAKPLVIVR